MQDSNNSNLSNQVRRFFKSLTDNKDIIDLAVNIQNGLEQGHSCINFDQNINDNLISDDGSSGYIVHNTGKAGFRRFYNQEQFIQDEFQSSNKHSINTDKLKQVLNQLKAISKIDVTQDVDLQWQASLAFLLHNRFILSGGPGTGKTTTVIRMMLMYKGLYPENKIALAAPTGKAANRLIQSIHSNVFSINLPTKMQETLSTTAQTLHRLLGYNPQNNKLKYNQNNPLPYDLIIVDESSMLDISMTHCLLKALKPSTQLVLIGDKNQLPAVEAGNVFADLCESNKQQNISVNILRQIEANTDINNLKINNYVELTKNYRFIQGSIVYKLSTAMINEDYQKLLSYKVHDEFSWINPINKEVKVKNLTQWYKSIPINETGVLLSPTNFGKNSVDELNQLATRLLYGNKQRSENMPIMVTKNDYTLNIFNGDIGHLQWLDGKWQVVFIVENQKQHIQLDAIHQWQIAHAISIHKSQGSEYDHVLIAIPDNMENEILTNQLLYTAITRAKSSVTLWASEEIVNKIMTTNANRMTFLN